MATEIIRSRQNARVKELRKAFASPGRESGDIIAIEGPHLLQEAIRAHVPFEQIFLREDSVGRFDVLLRSASASVPVHVLANDVFDSVVATEAPQGIAATVKVANHALNHELLSRERALVLVLDAVQDPGNLGTIFRSAEAFGANCVLRLPGTASAWNMKTIRASAGSVWRMPSFSVTEDEAFEALRAHSFQLVATVARDGDAPESIDWGGKIALLIGSEGRGLSPEWIARATQRVTLPMSGPVESLNAAIATSLLLYEASKHRSRRP